jgi:hypothetical protein
MHCPPDLPLFLWRRYQGISVVFHFPRQVTPTGNQVFPYRLVKRPFRFIRFPLVKIGNAKAVIGFRPVWIALQHGVECAHCLFILLPPIQRLSQPQLGGDVLRRKNSRKSFMHGITPVALRAVNNDSMA